MIEMQIEGFPIENIEFKGLEIMEEYKKRIFKTRLTLSDSFKESQEPLLEAEAEKAEEAAAERCGCRTGFVLNFAKRSSIEGAFVALSDEVSFSWIDRFSE